MGPLDRDSIPERPGARLDATELDLGDRVDAEQGKQRSDQVIHIAKFDVGATLAHLGKQGEHPRCRGELDALEVGAIDNDLFVDLRGRDQTSEVGLALSAQRTEPWEVQMLYGVRRDRQAELVAQGHTMRVYVPYGVAWYPYLTRRLAERPANLTFFARALVRG